MFANAVNEPSIDDLDMNILVVDDEPSIVQLLQLALQAMGFKNVETANSAINALEKIEKSEAPVDCFLVDIQMPEMDGMELCKALREMPSYRRTPILMLTAMSDRDYIEQSFTAGANDYIMKPFEIDDLVSRVKSAAHLHSQIASSDGVLQDDTGATNLPFENSLSFHGVPGYLEQPTFKNYIDRMERSQFRYGGVVAVKVSGADKIHKNAPVKDFLGVLTSVSDAISAALDSERCHFTYAGSGCFFVMKLVVEKAGFHKEVQSLVEAEIKRADLRSPVGNKDPLRISVGRLYRDAAGDFDSIDATLSRARERAQVKAQ